MRRVAGVAIGLAYLAASLPDRIFAFSAGLDPSWVDSINEYARSPFVFGRDFVFTYGPLGYVLRPLDLHDNLRNAFACRAFVGLAMAALLVHHLLRGARLWQVGIVALGFVALPAVGVPFEYQIAAALLLACISALAMSAGRMATLAVAAGCAAAVSFMNLGMGVLSFAVLAATWLALLRRDLRAILVSAAAWLATWLLLARSLFPSWRDAGSWLSLSRELVGGYDLAMAVWNGPALQVALALGMLAVFAAFGAALLRSGSESAPAVLLGLVPLALSFKHSFVRHDVEHLSAFFGMTGALALAILLTATAARVAAAAGALALVSIATLGLSFDARLRPREIDSEGAAWSVTSGGYRLHLLQDLEGQRSALREIGAARLTIDQLPDRWRSEIGAGAAMIVPFESAMCRANGLRCLPYPTLQMYATYTPALDRWAARRLEAAPPQFVVLSFAAIDGRSPVLDAPEVWQTLLDRYEVVEKDLPLQRLLLRRRAVPLQRRSVLLPASSVRLGEWAPIPEGAGWLRARLEVSLSVVGWIHRALYKAGPMAIQVRYRSGAIRTFRLVAATAADGLLIDGLPADADALAALFEGRVVDRVLAFRLLARAPGELRPEIPLRFLRLAEPGPLP